MPGTVRPVIDERDALLAYLEQQRLYLRLAAYGLTDEQATIAASASSLTVGGLIKHVANVEHFWIDGVVLQHPQPEHGPAEYEANFRIQPGETLADVLAMSERVARETEMVIAGIADLGQPVPVPKAGPWFPDDVDAWSVRWVLLHLISETGRHAGHADLVRESIDGAHAFPLMAAAEGWPATPWMQPWEPPVSASQASK